MRRLLLFCCGIFLGFVALCFLGGGSEEFVYGKRSFDVVECLIGLSLIVLGAVVTLGAGLCLGRAIRPLISVPARGETTVSGSGSAIVGGGGPVLPICGLPVLYIAFLGFFFSIQEEEQQTWQAFGVLWLVVGVALLATPLFLKRHVWQLGWRVNELGWGIAFGGFLLSCLGLFVWRISGTILHYDYEFYELVGLFVALAGTILTVFGGIRAVATPTRRPDREDQPD